MRDQDSWILLIPLIHAFDASIHDSIVDRGRNFDEARWWGTQNAVLNAFSREAAFKDM